MMSFIANMLANYPYMPLDSYVAFVKTYLTGR